MCQTVEFIHGGVEDGVVGLEGDLRATVVTFADHFHRVKRFAVLVFLHEVLAFAENLCREVLGEGVHAGDTDTVQTAGDLVGILVELTAGVQDGHDDLQCGAFLLRVHVGGDTTTVIKNAYRVAFQYLNFNVVTESGESLVDGVVHHLVDQMVQTTVADIADIHSGTFTHSLQAFQNLNITRTIGFFVHSLIL